MAFKNILVYLDNDDNGKSRLEAALDIAEKFEAHLVGLFVMSPYLPALYDTGPMPPELVELQEREIAERSVAAQEMFDRVTAGRGVGCEWRNERGSSLDEIARQARYADLVILGQGRPNGGFLNDLTDRLILTIGRPVLVIPYIGVSKPIGKRVIVAWDAGAHAARAVHDALPLLKQADDVDVLAVNPKVGGQHHGEIPSADIALSLARHGVPAVAHSISATDIGIADMILSRISDQQADLLVMGAYGHSRIREIVLGGVTRQILSAMTVPVLMSH